MISLLVSGWIAEWIGWPWIFYTFGTASIVWYVWSTQRSSLNWFATCTGAALIVRIRSVISARVSARQNVQTNPDLLYALALEFTVKMLDALHRYVFWFFLAFDSPARHPGITLAERSYIVETSGRTKMTVADPSVPWRKIFLSPPVWAICIAHAGNNWGWVPDYIL